MDGPIQIFVSYSHKDEALKDALLEHLAPLQREGRIAPWTDRDIVPGEAWEPAIFDRLEESNLILLLVSSSFLASNFCYDREMKRALELRARGKARVVPVIVRPCDWKTAPFADFQGLPKDAQPISKWDDPDDAWLNVVKGIRRLIDGAPDSPPSPTGAPLISTSGLPASGTPVLIGRDAELKQLDAAWDDPDIRVITFVAIGGAGKTTLVDHWLQSLEADQWRDSKAVFVWSFYSQGAGDNRQATGDAFIDAALRFFGDPDPKKGSPRDRGLRLAGHVRARRTLLVLDGLEPIQEPPTSGKAGSIKDPAVAALVRELASTQPGLVVITTREPVADLANRAATSAPAHDLERLSNAAGASLLRRLGVDGRDDELEEIAGEMRGHCLGITLLGTYLSEACKGDVRAWRDAALLDAAETLGDEKAFRVMVKYAEWFDGPERQILSLLGLFDRPADAGAVEALRKEPAIPGLTDELIGLSPARWNTAISKLRQARMLLEAPPDDAQALDAHPLVREHFGRTLEQSKNEAFRAGHSRLYEHYANAAPDLPDTLEEMQPLYRAVHHGCRADRRQEALSEIYHRRIDRGALGYGTSRLGAYGSAITAISGLFEQTWNRPSEDLNEDSRAWLLNESAFCLRALGRLDEAVQLLEVGRQARIDAESWENAAISASNLSALTLTLGQVEDALSHGASSVELADRSGSDFQRLSKRATWGDALHAAGRLDEAESVFREAESLQANRQPQYPNLYSLRGYRFCDLILGQAAPLDGSALAPGSLHDDLSVKRLCCRQVRERATQSLEWAMGPRNLGLLSIALHHLSLGRAYLGLSLADGQGFDNAAASLDRAVQGLRKAGTEDHLPRGLIARAMLHRFRQDSPTAEADLEEALEIAERGSMKLFECDVHLEWGRLRLSVDDREGAREHLDRAANLVETTGYHRRDREVAELRQALDGEPPSPESGEGAGG